MTEQSKTKKKRTTSKIKQRDIIINQKEAYQGNMIPLNIEIKLQLSQNRQNVLINNYQLR